MEQKAASYSPLDSVQLNLSYEYLCLWGFVQHLYGGQCREILLPSLVCYRRIRVGVHDRCVMRLESLEFQRYPPRQENGPLDTHHPG